MTRQWRACWVMDWVVAGGISLTGGAVIAQSVVLESAEMGTAGRIGGTSIATSQFVGWRFAIDEPLAVQRVGGHMLAFPDEPGEIFAAFVRLDSLSSVPHGAPFTDDEVVATTLFRPGFPSDEFFTPLEATLLPGSYTLVFGTGLFGATGSGALHNGPDQPDIPPTDLSSFIYWSIPSLGAPHEWRLNLASHIRVVIEAEVFHLPGDYDQDEDVDPQDYDVWKTEFGSTDELDADGNEDGVVDAADYTIWQDNLGASLGGAGTAAIVPEPVFAARVIAAIALLMAAARGRPVFMAQQR